MAEVFHGLVELLDETPAVEVTWSETDTPHAVFHYRLRVSLAPSRAWLDEFQRPQRWVPFPRPTDFHFDRDRVYFATAREDLRLKLQVLNNCIEQANAAYAYRREKLERLAQERDTVSGNQDLAHDAAREAESLLRSLRHERTQVPQ